MLVRHAPCSPPHALLVLEGSQQKTAGAVEYLREHPVPGALYNTFSFGSYLVGSLGPAHKVYTDGDARTCARPQARAGDVVDRAGTAAE
jgi:hypothetical protein